MIKKTERGRYCARVYFKGHQVAMATFDLKKAATLWEAEQYRELHFGTWVNPKVGDAPLHELVEMFNDARRGAVAEHTWDTDEANLRLHIPAKLLRLPIGSIQKHHITALFTEMMRTHARGTVSRFRNSLSSAFAFGVDRGLLRKNLVLEVQLPRGTGEPADTIRPSPPATSKQHSQRNTRGRPAMQRSPSSFGIRRSDGVRWWHCL